MSSFLSVQEFDKDGKIQVLIEIKREFSVEESSDDHDGPVGKLKSNFVTTSLSSDDVMPFSSCDEAEKYVLGISNVFGTMSSPPLKHIDEKNRSAQRIATTMANIATSSQRGWGNTVVYNPNLSHVIEQAKTAKKIIKVPVPSIDDDDKSNSKVDAKMKYITKEVLYFSNPDDIAWIENKNAPEDKVLVLYRGITPVDQPLIYVDGFGLILNNKFNEVNDYGKFTRVV